LFETVAVVKFSEDQVTLGHTDRVELDRLVQRVRSKVAFLSLKISLAKNIESYRRFRVQLDQLFTRFDGSLIFLQRV